MLQLSLRAVTVNDSTATWCQPARPRGARMHAASAAPRVLHFLFSCVRCRNHAGTLQLLLSAAEERRKGGCRIHTTALPLRCFLAAQLAHPLGAPACSRTQSGCALSLRENALEMSHFQHMHIPISGSAAIVCERQYRSLTARYAGALLAARACMQPQNAALR